MLCIIMVRQHNKEMQSESMTPNYLILRMLHKDDEKSFNQAIYEFKQKQPDWEFAFDYNESLPFSEYVKKLRNWSQGLDLPNDWVPNTYLVAVVGKDIVGRVSIRHKLNNYLEIYGGHIGYGVVPSFRNQGYAKEMLRQTILEAKKIGIQEVLVTADENNSASISVIESNGGVFENTVAQPEINIPKCRYWFDLTK